MPMYIYYLHSQFVKIIGRAFYNVKGSCTEHKVNGEKIMQECIVIYATAALATVMLYSPNMLGGGESVKSNVSLRCGEVGLCYVDVTGVVE